MIEVIQVTDNQFNVKIHNIYKSIFSRASQYHNKNYESKHKDVIFRDVLMHKNEELIKKYNIKSIPTTLFLKDGDLVLKKEGIMATGHILEAIENI
jgi:thioredoxin-related protein